MTTVIMPKMGDGMEEGTLLEWLKKEGEPVKSGEVIGTIQTDKATLELESPGAGVLKGVLVGAGQTVPVGQPIAAIVNDGEPLPKDWGKGGAAPNGQQPPAAKSAAPASAERAPAAPAPAPSPRGEASRGESSTASGGRQKSSPLARRIAQELGVELGGVRGSGPGGRVVEKDVRAAAERPQMRPVASVGEKPREVHAWSMPAPIAGESSIQLNKLRQITAQRTAQSKQQVPHFYVTVEVDLDQLMTLREMFEKDGSGKVSINDFVVRACALALREMPEVNSSFEGQTLKQHGSINIGMAVALDDGLTLPVIHQADELSIREISAAARDLAHKARENRLSLDELSGHTFSISNMGMLDVEDFSAIIVQPDSGILAISSASKKPVVVDGERIEARWRMKITGSFDHRVVDGAVGARFMNAVRAYLENPTRLL